MFVRTVALLWLFACANAFAEETESTLTVTGQGVAVAAPDRATLVLAVVSRAKQAVDAQRQVNETMNDTVAAVTALGVPAQALTTTGIHLLPLYEEADPKHGRIEPGIIGYQASNRIEVRLEDLAQVGPVIDAAVNTGANAIESVSLGLKDDRPVRRAALIDATNDARLRAEAIASAMGVRLMGVMEVNEQGVGVMLPRRRGGAQTMLAEAGTPVQSGQVRIEAAVVVSYRLSPATPQP